MIFGLNFYLSLLYSYFVSCYCRNQYYGVRTALIFLIPVFLIWLALCGGQYEVGTDYGSYLALFNGDDLSRYLYKGEVLFVSIIELCNAIGVRGQTLFYIFYSINFVFLTLIMSRFKSRQLFLFILLYIVVTSLFNNQLNILRQTTACYIGTYAGLLILENKRKKGLVFILLASMIHNMALVFLLFYANNIVCKLSIRTLFLFLIIFSFIGLNLNIEFLFNFIPFLPPDYAWHIQGGGVNEQKIFLIITKYIYLPIYLLSLSYFRVRPEKYNQIKGLYNWGILAFALRLFVVNLTIVSRIFDFFLLFSIFPLLFFLSEISTMRRKLYYIIVASLIAIYSAKVLLFPTGEYDYKSIYNYTTII